MPTITTARMYMFLGNLRNGGSVKVVLSNNKHLVRRILFKEGEKLVVPMWSREKELKAFIHELDKNGASSNTRVIEYENKRFLEEILPHLRESNISIICNPKKFSDFSIPEDPSFFITQVEGFKHWITGLEQQEK